MTDIHQHFITFGPTILPIFVFRKMDIVIFGLCFFFLSIHFYAWFYKMSQAPTYVSFAHGIHVIFIIIFMVAAVNERAQTLIYDILNAVILLESLELLYPFLFLMRPAFKVVFSVFASLLFGTVVTFSILNFNITIVVILLSVHCFMDLLYIFRPIRGHDIFARFFCGVASLYCLYEIYITLQTETDANFLREMYMVVHSSVVLSMSFMDDRPTHRALRVPLTQRSTTYDPNVTSPSGNNQMKRQGFVTVEVS